MILELNFIKEANYHFDIKKAKGLLRNLMIRTSTSGDLMVLIQFFYEDQEK